ncbi:MAG: carbonic anhydrase family protein [Rhizobacter sp.]
MFVPIRRLPALLLSTGLLCAASFAHTAEVPSIKTSPGKPALQKDPAPGRESTPGDLSRQKGAGAAAGSEDPMERLRERLSEKLGKRVASDSSGEVVKVAVVSPDGPAPRRASGGVATGGRRAAAGPRSTAWSYEGDTGPDHWSRLRPEYAQCGKGTRQSPIDIRDGIGVVLDPIGFEYQSTSFAVIDTGRTVQVNLGTGNSIEVMGRKYQLDRVEFRRPAEERINGRVFDMGAHLIHKDAEGRIAVVAVLLDRGAEQPVIQTVWNNLPLERGEELPARTGIDLSALLPSDRRYYTYMGSMTTPPCKEGVLWMVMKSPVAISSDQLAIFSRLYPMNARPVQEASGRLIKSPQ